MLGDFGDTAAFNWYNNANDLDSIIGSNFLELQQVLQDIMQVGLIRASRCMDLRELKSAIRFRIGADYSSGDDGWAIDDFRVRFGFIPGEITGKNSMI